MPLYQINQQNLHLVKATQFDSEKQLQRLVEENLPEIFGCRFIASEFSTGEIHGGRIDTLALSEDDNPVIIEYKKVESSDLVNQSLFYLSWIEDHKGDFEVAVFKALQEQVEVDWSSIRVICIAPGFKKYDLHAVKMMGAHIELYEYKLYENQTFTLEEVFNKNTSLMEVGRVGSPVNKGKAKPTAEKKPEKPVYTLESHLKGKSQAIQQLVDELRHYILSLDESIEEVPKKHYIAYKVNKNFTCIEVQRKKVYLYLHLDPQGFTPLPDHARDVSQIGHFGTGNLEYTVLEADDLEQGKELIRLAFENIGG